MKRKGLSFGAWKRVRKNIKTKGIGGGEGRNWKDETRKGRRTERKETADRDAGVRGSFTASVGWPIHKIMIA